MAHPIRLGVFAHFSEEGDPERTYDDFLDLFADAERLGYEGAWVRQFHLQAADGRRSGGLPSPFVFLAALAARTERLRLGTAAITLPIEQVLRVAEDAAVLDALSGGRLELGVANGGGQPGLAEAFGREFSADADTQRVAFRADLAGLVAALGGASVTAGGETVFPVRPALRDRIWEATLTDVSARAAARDGHGVLVGTTQTIPAEVTAAAYHEALPDGVVPRLGLSTLIYPAKDRETALREIEPGLLRKWEWGRSFLPPATTTAEIAASLNVHYGTSDDIAESIGSHPAFPYTTHVQVQVEQVYRSFGQRRDALEQFVREVAPSLGWVAPEAAGTSARSVEAVPA